MSDEKKDDLTTGDGRKILSFSAGGESYTVESTSQAAQGDKSALEAELARRRARFNPLAYWQGRDRSPRR